MSRAPFYHVTLGRLPAVTTFPPPSRVVGAPVERVRMVVDRHHDEIWRFLRRLGLLPDDVEDATQRVFVVFSRREARIAPGAERSFLFASALRIASETRRKRASSREHVVDTEDLPDPADPAPSVEDRIDDRRLRRWLDDVLETLSDEHRAVLVLVDLEEHTMADASNVLGIPQGTVASRLRRAREVFEAAASELKARIEKDTQ